MIRVELQGDKALDKALMRLELKTAKRIVRPAARKAMKPTLKAVKENARTMVGGEMGKLLARYMILRAFRRQRKGSYGLNVRLKGGVPEFKHVAADGTEYYIPAAIEYGHDSAAAIPFMRKAFDGNTEKSLTIIKQEIWLGILKEAGKA